MGNGARTNGCTKGHQGTKKDVRYTIFQSCIEQQIDFCIGNDETGPVDAVSDDDAVSKPVYNEHMFTFEKFEGVSTGVLSLRTI